MYQYDNKTFKKYKNKVFLYLCNDTMLGEQYSSDKMEVSFTLCKALLSLNVTHIQCVTFERTCSMNR